jgi:hypothetical protein
MLSAVLDHGGSKEKKGPAAANDGAFLVAQAVVAGADKATRPCPHFMPVSAARSAL